MSDNGTENERMPASLVIFLSLLVGGAVSLMSWVSGGVHSTSDAMREAVKQGHAEWRPDEHGKAMFKWLPACKPKTEDQKERKP